MATEKSFSTSRNVEEKDVPSPVDIEKDRRISHVDDVIAKHSHDADEAMKAFAGREGEIVELDEATNKRLLRIIDWNLMPILCVVYGMNYLDKTTVRSHNRLSKLDQGSQRSISIVKLRFDNGDQEGHSSYWRQLPMARFYVLLWLPSLGVSHESTPPATATWEILCILCLYVGSRTGMLRRCPEFQWRSCSSIFLRGLRGRCDPWICSFYLPMVHQVGTSNQSGDMVLL